MRHVDLFCSRRSIHDTFNILTGEFEGFDYSNPLICHGKGSGGGTNTVETQTSNTPPPEIMAAYEKALGRADTTSNAPLQQYQGNTVAGFTPDQMQAFGTINNAQGTAQPYINQAAGLIQQGTQPLWNGVQQFSPDAVNQYANPYTQQVLQSAMAGQQNTDAQQQQALKGNAISSGAWGGDRAGVASAVLSGQQDLANNQTNAGILNQGYNQALSEFNTQQQAQLGANEANSYLNQQGAFGLAGLGTEALNSQLSGASAQLQSGALQQQLGQENLNVPYQNFLQQQAYPFQTSQYYANIAEGLGSNAGGTGTGSSSGPAPSSASSIAGLGLGGLGIIGGTGGFGADGWLASLFAKRGGRIPARRRYGGGCFGAGGSVLDDIATGVPDLSISYVPVTAGGHGAGPPKAAAPSLDKLPQSAQDQLMNPSNIGNIVKALNSFGGSGDNSGAFGGSNPLDVSGANAVDVGGETNPLDLFSGSGPAGMSVDWKRGGRAMGYDDGGMVGGQAPSAATATGQQMPTQQSYVNSLSPQQLQNMLMRVPVGSQQSQQIQQIINQKRSMPNVGQQAQGGFGAQPAMKRGGRTGFADGGYTDDDDGIYIDTPPSPEQIARQTELQNELGPSGDVNTPVPASALAPPGALGSGPPSAQMVASAAPPPATGGLGTQMVASAKPPSDYSSEEPPNTRAKAEPNPWLALANAGFSMAAGQSPYALENIGKGAVAGLKDYTDQQKEADTVNNTADKLMAEAKQHRDALAIEQQNADTNAQYRQDQAANNKAERQKPIPDGMGGFLIPNPTDPTHPQHIDSSFGSTTGVSLANAYKPPVGDDGKLLTGDAYLAALPPQIASMAKQIANGDVAPISGFGLKNPALLAAQSAAQNYDPTWNGRRYAEIKQFDTGPQGNTTRAFNVATGHLALMSQLADALGNGDVKQVNALAKRAQTELGLSAAPNNFDALRNLVSGEVVKATTGTGGALGDREAIDSTMNKATSPKILKSTINDVYLPAMKSQLEGLEQQYSAGTGLKNYRDKYLLPRTQEALGYKQSVNDGGGMPTISSPNDPAFQSLPPGTAFMTLDGRTLVKH